MSIRKKSSTESTGTKRGSEKSAASPSRPARKAASKTAAAPKLARSRAGAVSEPGTLKRVATRKSATSKVKGVTRKPANAPAAGAEPAKAPRKRAPKPVITRDVTSALPKRSRATQQEPAEALRKAVLAALEEVKARDLVVLDVRAKTSVTDYFVIVSGTSSRHVKSLAEEVIKAAKALKLPPLGVEGEREGEWIVVDLGDLVVHLMQPRVREFYALEKLWGVGEAPLTAIA